LSCYAFRVASSKTAASRVDAVARQLREGIFQGIYPPGSPLRELEIARRLNVSQGTVREALRGLEHAGLLAKEANRGSTVTRLTPKDIRERVTLRALLETVAAQQAAELMGEADFAEIEKRLAALDSAVRSDKYYDAAQADLDFHRYIWQCSGNETLCKMLELITVPLFAFISILRSQGLQRLVTVVDAHEPLISALRSRDRKVIQSAFETGAVGSYRNFLGEGDDRAIAAALGLVETSGVHFPAQ
jgi:DNA-binding GntR family transcriptional regulator